MNDEEESEVDIRRNIVRVLIAMVEVWMAPTGYIISYPISDAKDFNMVLSHFRDPPVESVQEVSVDEVRKEYESYDPRIKRVIDMIKPPISRWPLLVTGPLPSWSSPEKNIVLMGDAAHSMTNHMVSDNASGCYCENSKFLEFADTHAGPRRSDKVSNEGYGFP